MEIQELETVESQAVSAAQGWLTLAQGLVIETPEQAKEGASILTTIAGRRKAIEEFFEPLVKAANAAHKALTSKRAAVLAQLEAPERLLRNRLASYQQEQERQRLTLQGQALEAARQEAERQKYAAAEAAMDKGELERAERILDGPAPMVAPAVVEQPEALNGVSFTENWTAEVDDLATLVAAVAAGRVQLPAVMADMKVLNQMARSLKSAFNVPGCHVVCQKVARVRT